MTREDEYVVTLNSGKIVMLISGTLCAMLACFVAGLIVGKNSQRSASAPATQSGPVLSRVEPRRPAEVSLPEIPRRAERRDVATTSPPARKAEVAKQPPAPQPAPKRALVSTKPAAAPSVSAPAPIYTICVLSARQKDGAERYASRLRKQGYKATVRRTQLQSGAVWYRTVIGEFADRKAAERQMAELKKKGKFTDAFITRK